jgi:protein tyrosine/serine phosphatase
MKNLEKMGIKTVVNLRLLHSDEDELEGTNLKPVHIEVEAWDADEDEVIEFLEVVSDPANLPAFVHCHHGSDRTGMMCAIYRLVVCGWDRKDAIQETTRGEFGYHRIWKDLVAYLEKLDVEHLRRAAGVESVGCPG